MAQSPQNFPQLTAADLPDAQDAALARERNRNWKFTPGSLEARVFSTAMTAFGAWRLCKRRQCRRARRCAAPRVDCFAFHHAFVCAHLPPMLITALNMKEDDSSPPSL